MPLVVGGSALIGLFFAWLPNVAFHYPLAAFSYDGSTYVGASIRLAHGVFPYRDFTFVQPPGITLLLFPVALWSYVSGSVIALELARIVTMVFVGLNCGLVAYALRFKGLLASTVGGLFCALLVYEISDDFSVELEPYLLFFCLLAVIIAFDPNGQFASRRRTLWAGVAFGAAMSVKLWAVFPVLVMVGLYLAFRRSALARFGAGVAAGFGVPCLVFLAVDPGGLIHDVLFSQLARASSSGVTSGFSSASVGVTERLSLIAHDTFLPFFAGNLKVCEVVVIAVVATYAVRWKVVSAFEWFGLAATAVGVAILLIPPEFFAYYWYFPQLFFALVLGGVFPVWVRALSEAVRYLYPNRLGDRRTASRVVLAAAVLAIVGISVAYVPRISSVEHGFTKTYVLAEPAQWIDATIPAGSCVVSDYTYFTLAADRFSPARSGCPALVDPYGSWLAVNPSHPPPNPSSDVPRLTKEWRQWLSAADYAVLATGGDRWLPWTPALRAWFAKAYTVVGTEQSVTIYKNLRLKAS